MVSSLGQLLGSTLQELDLTSCVNVTDLSVLAISTYLLKLVILRLGWCKEIKDKGLLGTVEKCVLNKKLVRATDVSSLCVCTRTFSVTLSLRIRFSSQEEKGPTFTRTFGNMGFFKPPNMEDQPKPVTQLELQQLKRSAGASLLALSRLQELDLTACSKLTDNSITQVKGSESPRLRLITSMVSHQRCSVFLGGEPPGSPSPLSRLPSVHHRRQPSVGGLALQKPHQPVPEPLSWHQRPRRFPGCSVPSTAPASQPLLL